jgi:hypothetical protein
MMAKRKISEEIRKKILAEPDTMKYVAIARKYGISGATVNAIRGPRKGRGKRKSSPPPSKKDAKPEPEAEPEEIEAVDCELNLPQIDAIYNLLSTRQKAIAVLSAVTEEA